MLNNVIIPKYQSMKVSDYFEYIKTEYTYVELIVTKANKNNNTDQISSLVNEMYVKTNKFICKDSKKLVIEQKPKASLYIHITKDKVQFFFILPKMYLNKFKVKFQNCWKNIEIVEVDNIPIDANSCSKFDVHYENNNSLSIAVDKRNNDLLNSNMSIVNMLEENEVCGILYNFIPTSEKENNYFKTKTYKNQIKDYKQGKNPKLVKTKKDYAVMILKICIDFINDTLDCILNNKKDDSKVISHITKEPSPSTNRKVKSDICKSQIILLTKSEGENKDKRENELGKILANTFEEIKDDNKLVVTKITKNIDINKTVIKNGIKNVKVNKTTHLENSNFISMPSLEVIKQFDMIKHNKVLELKSPKCLDRGEIRIGMLKNKEESKTIYFSTDEQMKRMSRVLMGSMGAGKDFFMANYLAKDIIAANRGLFVIDYIDECQLANSIKAITPKERLIEINCDNIAELQAFLYNEISYKDSDDIYKRLEISMQKAQLFELLLDSINDVKSELTPRMLRYLYCAGTVAIMIDKNSSFKDIVTILKSPEIRNNIIENMSEEMKEVLSEEIEDLKDLNKIDKNKKIENYDSKVDGILDRIARLKSASLFTKMAYMKNGNNNVDFIKAMNERKVVLIKIPHKSFKNKMLKDLMCTFYLSKIWLAKQESDKSIQTEVFLNEIHQSPHSQLLLEDILVEHRKQNITFTFALHYLDQLTSKCKKSIMSSGASFMLLSGCDPKAFMDLKTYFEKDGYTETDVAELDRFHALCLIKNEDTNYSSFIVDTTIKKD